MKATDSRIRLRIVDGALQSGYVMGKLRDLQLPLLKPVQIAAVTTNDDAVSIQLRDLTPFTRLHVYGTRYLPSYSGYSDLSKVRDIELASHFPLRTESIYLAGRIIGDEYQYVLDRRNQKKYPGNMLARPALLLNPWVVRSTESGEQQAQSGKDYDKVRLENDLLPGSSTHEGLLRSAGGNDASFSVASRFENLDFLADAATVLSNLIPDKNGMVKIPRKLLGAHSLIHIVAVDPVNTTARTISLPEQHAQFVDLRLHHGMDPNGHFTQQKQASILKPNEPLVLDDVANSRFEVYDSLAKTYRLYATLSHDPKLAEFSFMLKWPMLKRDEKLSLYSKFACHELNFFIANKDPEFFKTFVKPYVANKKDKTFLDHWLLEDDLKEYLQPWKHARLNTVERILLAQRIAQEQGTTARHLNDLLRLLPPDLERERLLFEATLAANQLGSAADPLVLEFQKSLQPPNSNMLSDHRESGKLLEERMRQQAWSQSTPTPVGAEKENLNRIREEKLRRFKDTKGGGGGGLGGGRGESDLSLHPNSPTGKNDPVIMSRGFRDNDGSITGIAGMRDGSIRAVPMEPVPWGDNGIYKGVDFLFNEERGASPAPARLYRRVDATEELAENNYYKLPIQQQTANLVGVSNFWVNYAEYDGKGPFLSRNLAEASRNFTEVMFALSVLDLPFTPAKQEVKFENGRMTFSSAGTVLALHESVKSSGHAANSVQILVSQNFYRHGDRYRDENGERFDKFITDEFVVHTVYGCQVVVTNPTPSRQRLSLLYQVPLGAIPVANAQQTRSLPLDLEPYRTQVVDFLFYFPRAGKYPHYPVHVAKAEKLIVSAAPATLNVVDKPTKLDTESWDFVSQNGTADQVVAMMNRENINALDLDKIAFRMKERRFYESVLTLLKTRHAWNATLWSYSLLHNDVPAIREYCAHMDQLTNECGGPIVSPFMVIDPVAIAFYEHLEFKPLVNARAHALGNTRQIVNQRFHQQYHQFVKLLSYRNILSDDEQLAVTYYLLLQDRIEEAIGSFERVNPQKIATRMQYDYCAAYLDMFNDEPKKVRTLIAQYLNHPVERWRNAFTAIANQLDEFDGKAAKIADKEDQAQQQATLATKEPAFEFKVAAKTINLTWKNVETIRINYYLMDVELLFSRNPFVQQSGSQFSMIRPNQSQEMKLPNFQTKQAIPMPENLADKNVLVEITANGKTRSVPVLANAMAVTLNENYGQLQVTDAVNGKMLSKVYVKTYVRLADGTVKFHKDGYTDHRGKFDYASVSTPEKTGIAKFGILVLSESQGAIIREAAPPQQ